MSSSSFELGRDAKKLVEHFRRGQFPLGSFNEVDCHDCNRGDVDLLTADALVHEPVTLVLMLESICRQSVGGAVSSKSYMPNNCQAPLRPKSQ